MRMLMLCGCLCAGVGAGTVAAETPLWARGVPPELTADNPYLPSCRAFAARESNLEKSGKTVSLLFRTWGVLADKTGPLYGNVELRKKMFDAFDALTLKREKEPSGYWTILEDCENFNLWRLYGGLSPEQLKLWKERLRPSFEAALKSITDESQWMSKAANTLLQTAMSLEFGAILYEELDPADPSPKRWREQARKNIARALEIQLPGGAFSYIVTSGPDPVYFNFDAAHLGRYYQLTADPVARKALEKLGGWAGAATSSGWLTPFSSPWRKRVCGPGGAYFRFRNAGARSYRAGERFGSAVSVRRPGRPELIAGTPERIGAGNLKLEIRKAGKPYRYLIYDPGKTALSVEPVPAASAR